jgi:hypothetical protein
VRLEMLRVVNIKNAVTILPLSARYKTFIYCTLKVEIDGNPKFLLAGTKRHKAISHMC